MPVDRVPAAPSLRFIASAALPWAVACSLPALVARMNACSSSLRRCSTAAGTAVAPSSRPCRTGGRSSVAAPMSSSLAVQPDVHGVFHHALLLLEIADTLALAPVQMQPDLIGRHR